MIQRESEPSYATSLKIIRYYTNINDHLSNQILESFWKTAIHQRHNT